MLANLVHFDDGVALFDAAALLLPPLVLCLAAIGFMRSVDVTHPAFNGVGGFRLRHTAVVSLAVGAVVGSGALIPAHFEIALVAGSILMSIAAGVITWNARKAYAGALTTVAFLGFGACFIESSLVITTALTRDAAITMTQAQSVAILWLLFGLPSLVISMIVAFISTRALMVETDAVVRREVALAPVPTVSPLPPLPPQPSPTQRVPQA